MTPMSTLLAFGFFAILSITKPTHTATDTETWIRDNIEGI